MYKTNLSRHSRTQWKLVLLVVGKVVFLAVTIVVNLVVEIFAVHRGMFFEWTNSIESMRKFIIAKSINRLHPL